MSEHREYEEFEKLLGSGSGFAEGELAKLASLARALERNRPQAASGPRPEFRQALRATLIEESQNAIVIPLPLHRRVRASLAVRESKMRRSFRMVVATAAAVMMLLVSGAAFAASAGSKPGDTLYSMKRARESLQLAVTFGAVPKAHKQLDFARERLEEIKSLADAGVTNARLYVSTLKDMDGSTADATKLLIDEFRAAKDASVLQLLVDFTAAQRQGLETVVDQVPPAARPSARGSIEVLAAVQDRVSSVLGGCPCSADIFTPAAAVPDAPAAKPCTCSSNRNDSNGVPTRNTAAGPRTEPTAEPTAEPTPEPSPTQPAPGPVEQVTTAVNDLISDIVPGASPTLPTLLP
ncbi:MAG: DUF5667 domain-containing protein [Actinomycetota bacterium]|nr:DUF5667 domain-containing protein [Actinomycetota bacterium]